MQTSISLRLLAVLGPLLALSCWISAALLFGNLLGESFSDDPVEQAHMAASRRLLDNRSVLFMADWTRYIERHCRLYPENKPKTCVLDWTHSLCIHRFRCGVG